MEDKKLVPLLLMEEGEEGIVEEIQGGERLISRLAGLGITEGVHVRMLRNIQGPLMVLASDTRIALGRGEAKKIIVKKMENRREEKKEKKHLLVALAGQPNVGKSTVFNVLTGLSQHVGNWPGKTVEKKEGVYTSDETIMKIVDLPGTYSLSSFSEEERIARDFILREKPDVIAVIVNASTLERSLYLLSELLLLGPPIVLGVNMLDVAEEQGINIDIEALKESLGIPVVPMVATKNKGIKELVREIIRLAEKKVTYRPKIPEVASNHINMFENLLKLINGHVPEIYPKIWCVVKLMEGDKEVTDELEKKIPHVVWNEINGILKQHEDALRAVVAGRYDWIEKVTRSAVKRFKPGQVLLTDRIDRLLTNPFIGIPVLIGVLGLIFFLTYRVGLPLQNLLEGSFVKLGVILNPFLRPYPEWISGLIVDGIIAGVGSVVSFVPILGIFFATLALLEDTGYVARVAFVMDRFMHILGLHGKSFLPLCLGFGCNVPAVLTSRIVESRKAQLLTVFLSPFVPCVGRLGVLAFLSGALFFERAAIVMGLLVSLNLIILVLVGTVMSRFLRLEAVPFIMELPLYHKPSLKNIISVVANRIYSFIKRAGTVILVFSILLWLLSNFPSGTVEESYLAKFGKVLERFGVFFGLDWKLSVALLSSIVAKENSIATLGVLFGAGEEGLRNVLIQNISSASLMSFLVILMLFIPCVPTFAVLKSEIGSAKWFTILLFVMLFISLAAGFVAYRLVLIAGL
ncbi:MAG: ferrous iron transport protein B [Deltaproteobacteria bacterium]|nr:ferrous iron transport protein B [Deltaproteobacteria bacterium]